MPFRKMWCDVGGRGVGETGERKSSCELFVIVQVRNDEPLNKDSDHGEGE